MILISFTSPGITLFNSEEFGPVEIIEELSCVEYYDCNKKIYKSKMKVGAKDGAFATKNYHVQKCKTISFVL